MDPTIKKQKEKDHISNLLDVIEKELGPFSIFNEGECPDFIVTLSDGTKLGIEETECCPSAPQYGGSRKIKDEMWTEKVKKEFINNKYLIAKSQSKRLKILIYTTSELHKKRHSVKECCEEIEKHLQHVLEPATNPMPIPKLICKVKANYVETEFNIINFNHIARRDAIKAKELIRSIMDKEKKRKNYNIKENTWLCIFLPFPENRHPYEIDYDDECTQEEFESFIKESGYKRIYITSELKGIDIKRIK